MTKLNGTSGQLFSAVAESINARGTVRSGKSLTGQGTADSGFHDLLHTVSNLAKRALNDSGNEAAVKSGTLRTHLAQLTERDESKDETVDDRVDSAEEPQGSGKHDPLDLAPKAEVQSRLSLPTTVGSELAAAALIKPQAEPLSGDKKDAPARSERFLGGRELSAASVAKAQTADIAQAGTRTQADAPQLATVPQGNAPTPKAMPGASGFEAVTANVERAAKVSARDALPEAAKVTVVQQETHLPPVAQFTAPQQVANAVVTELESSAAPASTAAPDLASAQGNAPDQPLKILTISLEPPALGNVTVRLRLVGEAVSVHLAADRKDTSQLLDQQRDSIRELMQSAGYVAEVAPVQHGALDGFQAGSGQSQPSLSGQPQSQNAQGSFDGSSPSSGQSDSGARQARDERQPNQETRHEQDVAQRTRRGPVYL
ncbi:flagellar hook-length control protein FliK [Bradyrhizobium sp. CCGUVB1N3]|uniref:flagellar hook-length control protein FliK n=1 Tax=Bradyrhizobium sp. CCGUVB1N3 TaxID=2949629 RepID=UPI0020B3942D|nr:flagellar hook-length control protein FliK [Bradyrhizobium sp. CCGUVB1N3]MCP3472677.1 flagellar hook-length control protein FliK [Bradyrhizobium sp. CCGUVB1N3]